MITPLFSRFFALESNEFLYDKAITELTKALDVYDQILAKQKYLAGDVSGSVPLNVYHANDLFDRKLLSRISTISLMGFSSDMRGSMSWRQGQTSIGLYLHLGSDIANSNANFFNPLLILRWFTELTSRDSWKAVLLQTSSTLGGSKI